MNPTPQTPERYLEIITTLIPKGWIPAGKFNTMFFTKNGRTYDLSCADLNQLDRIETNGLFIIPN